jgi:hypothetical protein
MATDPLNPLMYFGCPGLIKGDGTPGHTTYLPGGRPGGRPGLAGALVEREEAAKLYSVEEEAEEVVEEVVGVRDRFVLRVRVEVGESEVKVALPRAAA